MSTLTFIKETGILNVNTDDLTLDDKSWLVRIERKSIYSKEPQIGPVGPIGIQDIKINFLSKCRRAVVTAAVFDVTSITYQLYQA